MEEKIETALIQHVPIRRGRFLVTLFLCLASVGGWTQQLNVAELDTTAGRTFRFQSYTGPEPIVQTIPQISGIGEVLSRNLRAGGARGSYFGKYTVIRAYQASETSLLSADLIVLDAHATIDDIRNVQRIVAGYLVAEFGYDANQAARLSMLVTTYNAAHRGDIATLSQKYTPLVMSHLTAENAGIALSYTDWPGKTRLIIPLGVAPASQTAGGGTGGAPVGPGGPVAAAPGGGAAPSTTGAAPGSAGTPGGAAKGGAATTSGAAGAAKGGTQPTGGGATGGTTQAGGAAPAAGAPPGAGALPGAGASPSASTPGPNAGKPSAGGQAGAPSSPGTAGAAPSGTQPSGAPPAGTSTPAAGGRPRGLPRVFGIAWWWLLLALLALILLALVVFVLVRLIRQLATPSYEHELARSIREGHSLVEMVVIPQNRHIGNRNVHYLRPGGTASVGSGAATFLIYFVPVPRRVALLKYDGSEYTFIPLKTELFPGASGPVLDCLGKGIPARSLRGYRFTILFRRFVPPLEEINRLMRSTRAGSQRRIPPQP